MDLITALGAIVLVNIIAWLTPGPNMIAVASASLEHGRKHGIATGLGLACAAFVWAVFAVLGVAVLFELFPTAVLFLKLAGAGYLIWLGMKSLRTGLTEANDVALPSRQMRSIASSFRCGFVVSMTNPKAALFFGSIMTTFIPETAPIPFLILVILLSGILGAVLHSITATVFSTRPAMRFFASWKRRISVAIGAAFIGLGASIAVSALRRS